MKITKHFNLYSGLAFFIQAHKKKTTNFINVWGTFNISARNWIHSVPFHSIRFLIWFDWIEAQLYHFKRAADGVRCQCKYHIRYCVLATNYASVVYVWKWSLSLTFLNGLHRSPSVHASAQIHTHTHTLCAYKYQYFRISRLSLILHLLGNVTHFQLIRPGCCCTFINAVSWDVYSNDKLQ